MLLSCSLLSLSTIICLIVLFLLTICIVLSVRFYQSSMYFRLPIWQLQTFLEKRYLSGITFYFE